MNNQAAMRADQSAPTANDATATTGVPTTYMWDWSANVCVKESEIGRSFQVLIFLGSVPEDSREWCDTPSYAGAYSAFVASFANSDRLVQDDIVTQGAVGLNRLFEENEGLHTFDPHVVRPYLKNGLNWRIRMVSAVPLSSSTKDLGQADVEGILAIGRRNTRSHREFALS